MPTSVRQSRLKLEIVEGIAIVHLLDRTILQVYGEHDDISQIREQLYSVVEDGRFIRMIINLGAVEFMSTYMIAVLIRLKSKVEEAGGRLVICRLSPANREAFRITRLDRIVSIYRDEHSALATF